MMKKRISSLAVMLVMLFALAIPAAAAPEGANTDVKIVVDGKDLTSQFNEDTLWMEDGITMAGVRALGEAVGADVRYDSATGSVVVEGLKQTTGVYSPVADYEYLVGAAAWQLSAEAHALMMQAFNIAKENVDEMAAAADAAKDQTGYYWQTANGGKQLMYQGKRVAVVSDIDDTLVDGVHYTANILGRNGEWTNKSFADFVMSDGCTALPGAVEFINHCVENGIEVYYVTNRYDQGYKTSQPQYAGQTGYKAKDGSVIGSSVYEVVGKTFYDISMESMERLGFPTDDKTSPNYSASVHLLVNDNKINGSSKEGIRQIIATGGTWATGERVAESKAYPEKLQLSSHHIAMVVGDDLNDISQIFSAEDVDAVSRVALAIENMDKWGAEWIVLPNAVYGSSVNYATAYGITDLFRYFDYTNKTTDAWDIYQ